MNRADKLALDNSEVYQELELLVKRAQETLSKDLANKPEATQALTDGIKKALEGAADDAVLEVDLSALVAGLSDEELIELCEVCDAEAEKRDLVAVEGSEDEVEAEEDDSADAADMLAYVKSSLTYLAQSAAESGDTEAAYAIERVIQKIS